MQQVYKAQLFFFISGKFTHTSAAYVVIPRENERNVQKKEMQRTTEQKQSESIFDRESRRSRDRRKYGVNGLEIIQPNTTQSPEELITIYW
jgi:hypothetical protein